MSLRSTRSQQEMAHKMLFVLKRPGLGPDQVGLEQNGGPGWTPNRRRLLFLRTSRFNCAECSTLTARRATNPSTTSPSSRLVNRATEPPPHSSTESLHSPLVRVTKEVEVGRFLWAGEDESRGGSREVTVRLCLPKMQTFYSVSKKQTLQRLKN